MSFTLFVRETPAAMLPSFVSLNVTRRNLTPHCHHSAYPDDEDESSISLLHLVLAVRHADHLQLEQQDKLPHFTWLNTRLARFAKLQGWLFDGDDRIWRNTATQRDTRPD
jgi:hypothetical protein